MFNSNLADFEYTVNLFFGALGWVAEWLCILMIAAVFLNMVAIYSVRFFCNPHVHADFVHS